LPPPKTAQGGRRTSQTGVESAEGFLKSDPKGTKRKRLKKRIYSDGCLHPSRPFGENGRIKATRKNHKSKKKKDSQTAKGEVLQHKETVVKSVPRGSSKSEKQTKRNVWGPREEIGKKIGRG